MGKYPDEDRAEKEGSDFYHAKMKNNRSGIINYSSPAKYDKAGNEHLAKAWDRGFNYPGEAPKKVAKKPTDNGKGFSSLNEKVAHQERMKAQRARDASYPTTTKLKG